MKAKVLRARAVLNALSARTKALAAFAGVFVFGLALYDKPIPVDAPFTYTKIAGTALIFAAFVWGMLSWGEVISGFLKIFPPRAHSGKRHLASAALGTAFFAILISLVEPLGIVRAEFHSLWVVLLALGPILAFTSSDDTPKCSIRFRELPPFEKIAWIALFLAISLRVYQGVNPQPHGDPLLYHLLGPREAFDAGNLSPYFHNPTLFLCSYWENLYQWGNLLLAGARGTGLIAVHLFSQWTHALIGFGGAMLALAVILENFFVEKPKHARAWLILAVIAGTASDSLHWSASIAKNDWGVVFFGLAGTAFLFTETRASALFVGSVLLGMAAFSKLTLLPYAMVFGFFAALAVGLASRQRGLTFAKALGWSVLGGIAGALPIAARNFLMTGNPVFPWLSHVFPTRFWPGPSLQLGFDVATSPPSAAQIPFLRLLATGLGEWIHDQFLNIGFIVAVGYALWRQKKVALPGKFIIAAIGLTWLIFMWRLRAGGQLRYLGPMLVLTPAIGTYALAVIFRKQRVLTTLLLVTALVLSKIPLHELAKGRRAPILKPANIAILGHLGGESRRWLREHATVGDTVIQTGDNESYYATQFNIVSAYDDPELDRALSAALTTEEAVAAMRRAGGKWLHDSLTDPVYTQTPLYRLIKPIYKRHPDAVRFQMAGGIGVIDLEQVARDERLPAE